LTHSAGRDTMRVDLPNLWTLLASISLLNHTPTYTSVQGFKYITSVLDFYFKINTRFLSGVWHKLVCGVIKGGRRAWPA